MSAAGKFVVESSDLPWLIAGQSYDLTIGGGGGVVGAAESTSPSTIPAEVTGTDVAEVPDAGAANASPVEQAVPAEAAPAPDSTPSSPAPSAATPVEPVKPATA